MVLFNIKTFLRHRLLCTAHGIVRRMFMNSDLAHLSLETESQFDSLCTLIHLHFLQLLRDGGATDFSGCIKSYNLTWRARHYVIPAQPARESEREGERRRKLLSHQPPPLQSCHILDFTVKKRRKSDLAIVKPGGVYCGSDKRRHFRGSDDLFAGVPACLCMHGSELEKTRRRRGGKHAAS